MQDSTDNCEHDNTIYQAGEFDTNTPERYYCGDCDKDLELPEQDWDLMLKE